MAIERYIYDLKDLQNEVANIYLYISPQCKNNISNSNSSYILYVKALSLNESLFSIKIHNVEHVHLEAACVLVLNTLHMYYLPFTVCKDTINDIVEFTSSTFENMVSNLIEPHVFDTCDLTGWYNGTIDIVASESESQGQGQSQTFNWERPPFHVADVSDDGYFHASAKARYDEQFIKSIQHYRQIQSNNIELELEKEKDKPPFGFNHPCL